MKTSRRSWVKSLLATPLLSIPTKENAFFDRKEHSSSPLRLSLNAYSFNAPLREGTMSLDNLLDFTADNFIPALDLTAYYFPTYPKVPDDAFLYNLKRQVHRKGLILSGTGVRNNFTQPDAEKRSADVQLVRDWIDAAVKLGAPTVRVFAGKERTADTTEEEAMQWLLECLRECADYGKQKGIIVALQNHNEFVKTAEQVHHIFRSIDSEWLGLMLDIGSYRGADPYAEIAETIPYAVNWQLKENVYVRQQEQKTDIDKLMQIISESDYRGYLPIETLGPGDPYKKVESFLQKVRTAMNA